MTAANGSVEQELKTIATIARIEAVPSAYRKIILFR